MTLLLDLLGASDDGADHAWVLRRALVFLIPNDAVRLVVAVLESGGRDARRRVRFGDAPFPPIDEHELLGEAASHACWRALTILLEDLRAKAPSWISLYGEKSIEDAVDLATSSSLARATVAHRGTDYRFGADAVKAAAAHGHLVAVQWLIPRSVRASGHVEPTRREDGDATRFRRFVVDDVLQAAAKSRQLHIVEWIIKTSPELRCVLPYDEELEALCWVRGNDRDPSSREYSCVTRKYGFSRMNEFGSEPLETNLTWMPLADSFAKDGDLKMLEKIRARPNYRQLIGQKAIVLAAQAGHLKVVEWLYSLSPGSLSLPCLVGAARSGNLCILQWAERETGGLLGKWTHKNRLQIARSLVISAGSGGHVHVLRWFRSIDSSYSLHFTSEVLANAIRNGHLSLVKFLHTECGTTTEQFRVMEALVVCSNVDTFTYVLERIVVTVADPGLLLRRVAYNLSLEVVKHLVLDRGFWSRGAFWVAASTIMFRSRASGSTIQLEMSQFLYDQAHARARYLQTSLDDQVDLSKARIGDNSNEELAEWLLKCVPQAALWGRYKPSLKEGFVVELAGKRVILAFIKHRPDECRSLSWLPEWAARVNSFEALERLETSGHPNLRDLETYQAIVQCSRDSRLMLKLLPLPAGSPLSLRRDVVQWAAQFGMVTVLGRVLDNEDSKTQDKLLGHIVRQAGFSSHVEVVKWLLDRCSLLGVPSASVVKAIRRDALRHGHTTSLALLRKRQLLRGTSVTMGLMVSEAAEVCQVQSLAWLLENQTIPMKVIANTLIDAVRQNRTEVVAFITAKYEPSELPLRDHDRLCICGFLLKQGHKRDADVAASRQDETTQFAGRRIKRSRRK